MKIAIISYPGSNCERDSQYAFSLLGVKADILWHEDARLGHDLVVLPGGFSYGDYLRCAALAKASPVSKELCLHAKKGGLILGICNGFQILLELGLLSGAMLHNKSLHFIGKNQALRVCENDNAFCKGFSKNELISLPIAHMEGNYYNTPDNLKRLNDEGSVFLRYEDDINGSCENIAGISDKNKRIFGLMPHPERACEKLLGSDTGLRLLKGLLS